MAKIVKKKRGPKEKSPEDKKRPIPISAKLKNHDKILARIEPIVERMDKN